MVGDKSQIDNDDEKVQKPEPPVLQNDIVSTNIVLPNVFENSADNDQKSVFDPEFNKDDENSEIDDNAKKNENVEND